MYDQSQLMKGIMEGCILSIIGRERTYGYEIVERLREKGNAEGRIHAFSSGAQQEILQPYRGGKKAA